MWMHDNNALLALVGALAAHIAVNTLNEYADFKSGLDLVAKRTPFSGGSGALPNHPEAAKAVLVFGILAVAVTVLIGAIFVLRQGLQILPIGIAGIAIVIAYTKWINRLPWLCLFTPGLGFGVFMVVGTALVVSGEYSNQALYASLAPFFLINNLLLLNQYPDMRADAGAGRRTFPIVYGVELANKMYALFAFIAYFSIFIAVAIGELPLLCLIASLMGFVSAFVVKGANRYRTKIGRHPRHLAANVIAAVVTPLLLALGLVFG